MPDLTRKHAYEFIEAVYVLVDHAYWKIPRQDFVFLPKQDWDDFWKAFMKFKQAMDLAK